MVTVQAGNHYFVDSILGIWGGRPDSCHLYLAHLQQLVSSTVLAICTLRFQPIWFWMAEVSAALTAKASWIICGLTFCQHSWKYSFLLIEVDFATLECRTVEDFDDWTSWLFYKGGVGVKIDYSWGSMVVWWASTALFLLNCLRVIPLVSRVSRSYSPEQKMSREKKFWPLLML